MTCTPIISLHLNTSNTIFNYNAENHIRNNKNWKTWCYHQDSKYPKKRCYKREYVHLVFLATISSVTWAYTVSVSVFSSTALGSILASVFKDRPSQLNVASSWRLRNRTHKNGTYRGVNKISSFFTQESGRHSEHNTFSLYVSLRHREQNKYLVQQSASCGP